MLIKVALVLRNCQAGKKAKASCLLDLELKLDIKQSAHCRARRGATSVLVFHHPQGDEKTGKMLGRQPDGHGMNE